MGTRVSAPAQLTQQHLSSPRWSPPPTPAPPLGSLHMIQPIGAALSSNFHEQLYGASACIDGDVRTLCATDRQPNAWASIQLPRGANVDRVVVYNRADDNREYQAWLSPFEIWLGQSYGDTSSAAAVRCGAPALHVPATAGPFTRSCGSAPRGACTNDGGCFVTLTIVDTARWLTIAEIEAYSKPRPSSAEWSPSGTMMSPSSSKLVEGTEVPRVVMASYRPGTGVLRPPATPVIVSASCRSITINWAAPATPTAPSAIRFALMYAPTSMAESQRVWSTGLRETRATVTGLQPGVEYGFTVAVTLPDGTTSRPSSKLVAQTPFKCEAPKVGRDPSCHAGTAKEEHRLGVPQVNALSCSALVLELPPLPPDHCDEDPNQRLAIEAKHGTQPPGVDWYEIKHNVLSPTLILGGLERSVAYEFRMVLHRPLLGDRHSESSGLVVVTEPGASNVTGLRAAPTVTSATSRGERLLHVSWAAGAGVCRTELPFSVQAADAGLPSHGVWPEADARPLTWHTIARNATGGKLVLRMDDNLRKICSQWCTFRLLPEAVEGWLEATAPSHPVQLQGGGSSLLTVLLAAMLMVILLPAAFILYADPSMHERSLYDISDAASRSRLWTAISNALLDPASWLRMWETARSTLLDGATWGRLWQIVRSSLFNHKTWERSWGSTREVLLDGSAWRRAWETVRGAALDGVGGVVENVSWLSRAWVDGLGAYRRAAAEDDGLGDVEDECLDQGKADEEALTEEPRSATRVDSDSNKPTRAVSREPMTDDLSTEDFAPLLSAEDEGIAIACEERESGVLVLDSGPDSLDEPDDEMEEMTRL